jgi:hypothetical protein
VIHLLPGIFLFEKRLHIMCDLSTTNLKSSFRIKKFIFIPTFHSFHPQTLSKMAVQLSVNVYQINSQNPIPAALVSKIGFPTASIMLRPANTSGTTGQQLSSGQVVYGAIQVIHSGIQYLTLESEAQLVTLANA